MGRLYKPLSRTLSTVTDNFNRADGAVGGLWTPNPDGVVRMQFNVASNLAAGAAGGAWMSYNSPLTAPCEVSVDIAVFAGNEVEIELFRQSTVGAAGYQGYALLWRAGGSAWTIRRYDPGTVNLTNVTDAVTAPPANLTRMVLRLLPGGIITGAFRSQTGQWFDVGYVQDATYAGPFIPLMYAENSFTRLDNFTIGPLTGPDVQNFGNVKGNRKSRLVA